MTINYPYRTPKTTKKTTTTVYEYGPDGKVVKETVTEVVETTEDYNPCQPVWYSS